MSDYLNSTYREHVKVFDEYVAETEFALKKPKIAPLLGERATVLLDANSRLFLPNIKHGVVEIPDSHRDSDSIAFIPILEGEENAASTVGWGRSFFEVSPARKKLMLPGYSIGFGKDKARIALHLDLEDIIEEGLVALSESKIVAPGYVGKELGDKGIAKMRAFTTASGHHDVYETFPSFYAARPTIVIFDEMIVSTENKKAAALAHELWHATSIEQRNAEETRHEVASEEIAAYAIGHVINTYLDEANPALAPSAAAVNDFCERHGIDVDNIVLTDEQIAELESIGVVRFNPQSV